MSEDADNATPDRVANPHTRPSDYPALFSRQFPGIEKYVNEFINRRGKDGVPDWPRWCFLPLAGWIGAAAEYYGSARNPETIMMAPQLAAGLTWKYTQGIYKLDEALCEELLKTPVGGELPVDVLLRLPEHAVYVEFPNADRTETASYGFFAWLEFDVNTKQRELRLALHLCTQEPLGLFIVHLDDGKTLTECIEAAMGSYPDEALPKDAHSQMQGLIEPMVSILLYLCSSEPDITQDRMPPGGRPTFRKPEFKRIGKKFRKLTPPKKPQVFHIGQTIGAELREIHNESNAHNERSVRTHIRRGHWHGYWSGPRDGERRFDYKWLPPTIVRGREMREDDAEEASNE